MPELVWRALLGRFVAIFAGLSLVWVLVAPLYASLLAGVAAVVAPALGDSTDRGWQAEGTRIVVLRPAADPLGRGSMMVRQGLWDGRVTFTPALLAAALLATPGWSPGRRGRSLAIGLGALAFTQLMNLVVNALYTQSRPIVRDGITLQPGGSFAAQAILNALSYFFDTMGPVFFTILIYSCLATSLWRAAPRTAAEPRHGAARARERSRR